MFDRILDGIHANFATQQFNDPMFEKHGDALDWLCFGDLCDSAVRRKQQWKLMAFLSTACAGVHYLCRSNIAPHVEYPRAFGEMRRGRTIRQGMLASFSAGLAVSGAPARGRAQGISCSWTISGRRTAAF